MMKKTLIYALSAAFIAPQASAETLATYRSENRPLLIFAPDRQNRNYKLQTDALMIRETDIRERDMAVILITGSHEQPAIMPGPPAPNVSAADLRKAHGIGSDQFAVILIGKDGGEKGRWREAVSPDEIFAMIDAMPMRQREMRK